MTEGGPPEPAAFDPTLSRRAALRRATGLLEAAGIADPEREARFLLLGLLDLDMRDLVLDGHCPLGAAAARLDPALARRTAGEPVARILGTWEFWGLPFLLAPETLVPRPDTETVVEAALATLPDHGAPVRILDLGTGSGCILVALLSELPGATGLGLDRAPAALSAARANAMANGVGDRALFACGDWCDALRGPFDLVVSNPPYIASHIIADLDREVACHDPLKALDGGADGLSAYRRILRGVVSGGLLRPGAPVVLEVGYDQSAAVRALGEDAGLRFAGITHDLAGHARVLTFHH